MSTTTNGRPATYAPDLRNQYASRGVPSFLDVLGSAALDVNVLVDGEAPVRDGTQFHRALPVSNAAAPVFKNITIHAARPGTPDQVATETRSAFVARTPETFLHDLDGNLTQDGRWDYTWGADVARQRGDGALTARPKGCFGRVPFGRPKQQNRLVEISTRADVASAAPGLLRQKLTFAYDAQGRRIRKQVFTWSGTAWVPQSETKFLYDGWNLLAEYNGFAVNAVVRSHVWGLDLSGGEQGAGGVGGLLWTSTGAATYSPAWDANGNIVAWIDLANGTIAGRRDYGPFGEPLATTGVASSLPFAFSTKYRDVETDLYYYGFRYYNPSTGRWLSRDPIEEGGGLNLYGMVNNNPVNAWDYLGLWTVDRKGEAWAVAKPDGGDGYESLATLVSLNYNEIEKWAKEIDEKPFKKKDLVCPVKVPNRMVFWTSAPSVWYKYDEHIPFFPGAYNFVTRVMIPKLAQAAKGRGYKVEELYQRSSSAEFSNAWQMDGIMAFGMAGHGAASTSALSINYSESIGPSSISTPYKLSRIWAFFCSSGLMEHPNWANERQGPPQPQFWRMHVSQNGFFFGYMQDVGLYDGMGDLLRKTDSEGNEIPY